MKIENLSLANTSEIRALQLKELEILKYFKNICVENNLKFFLAGGSSIGALRHSGFIPWDDDVDVFMLRNDYETLFKKWNEISSNPKYSLCRSDETKNYHHAAMTLNDNDTTFINFRTINEDVNQGIAIDIIPMDFLEENLLSKSRQWINSILFSVYINQRLPDNQGKLLRFMTKIPLKLVRNKDARYHIWKKAEKRMISKKNTRSNVELVTGLKAMFRPLDSAWFEKQVWVDFEDTKMPVPVGYNEYLNLIFGDYMQMPPVENRKAKHITALVDTETPYLKYRGKVYLIEK